MNDGFRAYFPFFKAASAATSCYLDSAATTQKLASVLQATQAFYLEQNASVHRSAYALSQQATATFEASRATIAGFIGARSADEVVFTSGATESLNMLAQGMAKVPLVGNRILLCASEHHANLLPWQQLARQRAWHIDVIHLNTLGQLDEQCLQKALQQINQDTAILAIAHVSNALGNIYPIKDLCAKAKSVQCISVIDGTQSAAHLEVNVAEIDCDYFVFSGHKMYGPTGIGVLYGKYHNLLSLAPSKLGGEMVSKVSFTDAEYQLPPLKFEGGTPNLAGAVALAAAADFIVEHRDAIHKHEQTLYQYLIMRMSTMPRVQLLGQTQGSISTLAFVVNNMHYQDIAQGLYQQNIAARAGHHCAMPLMQSLGIDGCIRVSLACYNTTAEIDQFILALHKVLGLEELVINVVDNEVLGLPLAHSLAQAKAWDEQYRQLLLASKALKVLPIAERLDKHYVGGCENAVWMMYDQNQQRILAYSDSKVIRGIIAVLLEKQASLAVFSGGNGLAASLDQHLHALGLSSYFSQGRKDGVSKVISRIVDLLPVSM